MISIALNFIKEDTSIRSSFNLPTSLLHRPNLLKQMDEKLKSNVWKDHDIERVALVGVTGIGGVGKTTLTRHFSRTQTAKVVWELNAESKESLIESFKDLARELAITQDQKNELNMIRQIQNPTEQEKHLFSFVQKQLHEKKKWILIYDNLEPWEEMKKYLPQDPSVWGKGKVIITTRDSTIKDIGLLAGNVIHVNDLTFEECLELFSQIRYNQKFKTLSLNQRQEIQKFLKEIPPFPLDVSLAAAYLKDTRATCTQYLEEISSYKQNFECVQKNLLKELGEYAETRYGIIASSFERIIKIDSNFKELLLFICLLDSQQIPKTLLTTFKDEFSVNKFYHTLKKHSLITHESFLGNNKESLPIFALHRSLQAMGLAYLEQTLKLEKDSQLICSIAKAMETYINFTIHQEDPLKMDFLIEHCEIFLKHNCVSDSIKGFIQNCLGRLYYHENNFLKSKTLLEQSLIILKKSEQRNSIQIAQILIYLGTAYREIGDYKQAQILLDQGILIYKANNKTNDIDFAWSLANLGNVYKGISDYNKAEVLLKESIDIYKKHYGENSPKLALPITYLGDVYKEIGHYEKAEQCYHQTIKIYEKFFGKRHIKIAWVTIYLANLYKIMGRYQQAKVLIEESLSIYRKYLPECNTTIAWVLTNLGNIYFELGYYQDAKKKLEKALEINQKLHGENHLRSAWTSIYLGHVYEALDKNKDALRLMEKSLEIHSKDHTKDVLKIALILKCLGNIYGKLNKKEKSKDLLNQSLKIYEEHYGRNHTETAQILKDLGIVYIQDKEFSAAKQILQEAFKILSDHQHSTSFKALEGLADLQLKQYAEVSKNRDMAQHQHLRSGAVVHLEEALSIAKRSFSNDSIHIQRLQSKISAVNG